jgi:type II secretory pathway predicted ATPase ExeA
VLAGEAAERGRVPVLIIDEAHLLNHEQLKSIRMLTNHDYPGSTVIPGDRRIGRSWVR